MPGAASRLANDVIVIVGTARGGNSPWATHPACGKRSWEVAPNTRPPRRHAQPRARPECRVLSVVSDDPGADRRILSLQRAAPPRVHAARPRARRRLKSWLA